MRRAIASLGDGRAATAIKYGLIVTGRIGARLNAAFLALKGAE